MTMRVRFTIKELFLKRFFSENTPETVISSLPDAEKTRYDIFSATADIMSQCSAVSIRLNFITKRFQSLCVGVF